jgi:hypothetical protein
MFCKWLHISTTNLFYNPGVWSGFWPREKKHCQSNLASWSYPGLCLFICLLDQSHEFHFSLTRFPAWDLHIEWIVSMIQIGTSCDLVHAIETGKKDIFWRVFIKRRWKTLNYKTKIADGRRWMLEVFFYRRAGRFNGNNVRKRPKIAR